MSAAVKAKRSRALMECSDGSDDERGDIVSGASQCKWFTENYCLVALLLPNDFHNILDAMFFFMS